MKKYKAITVTYSNVGETAHYLVEDAVSEEAILSGSDEGVVCQVLDLSLIDTMLSALNGQHDTRGSKEDS